MTIYEISGHGMVPLSPEGKNTLERGRVLHMNGYNDPDFVIVANLGINPKFVSYGAKYLTVDVDTMAYSQHDAYSLKWLRDKANGAIQTYITDTIMPETEVAGMVAKADAIKAAHEANQARLAVEREAIEERGKLLFDKYIPATAKALIVAERHKDESDSQSDYFAHTTTDTIILAWSAHTKDLFAEMRKAAAKIPETAHLGPGKGHFEPHVMIGADIQSNGCAYWKGSASHWHHELDAPDGNPVVFRTRAEAETYIRDKGEPGSVSFDGVIVPFYWGITEREIEHRQKYSMGAGYYLKDGTTNCSGWAVRKLRKYGERWDNGLHYAMGKRCIFEGRA